MVGGGPLVSGVGGGQVWGWPVGGGQVWSGVGGHLQ